MSVSAKNFFKFAARFSRSNIFSDLSLISDSMSANRALVAWARIEAAEFDDSTVSEIATLLKLDDIADVLESSSNLDMPCNQKWFVSVRK